MPADGSSSEEEKIASSRFLKQIEVNQTLTALYVLVEASRWQCSKYEDMKMEEAFCMKISGQHVLLITDVLASSWPQAQLTASLDSDDCKAALGGNFIHSPAEGEFLSVPLKTQQLNRD